jgi:hypothetical protein
VRFIRIAAVAFATYLLVANLQLLLEARTVSTFAPTTGGAVSLAILAALLGLLSAALVLLGAWALAERSGRLLLALGFASWALSGLFLAVTFGAAMSTLVGIEIAATVALPALAALFCFAWWRGHEASARSSAFALIGSAILAALLPMLGTAALSPFAIFLLGLAVALSGAIVTALLGVALLREKSIAEPEASDRAISHEPAP